MLRTILLVSVLAACGGKTATPDTTTTNKDPAPATTAETPATGDGVPCTQEVALQCPEGQIDGCLKTPAEGTTHACVAK